MKQVEYEALKRRWTIEFMECIGSTCWLISSAILFIVLQYAGLISSSLHFAVKWVIYIVLFLVTMNIADSITKRSKKAASDV